MGNAGLGRAWIRVLALAVAFSVLVVSHASSGGAAPASETIVAGPMSNDYFLAPLPPSGPIEDLVFSVYALEVHRSPDGSAWVRDYNSIVQVSADETSFRRAVGLADSSGLGDPGINDSFDSIGLDPSIVPTQLAWEGGRRMAIDAQGRLVYTDSGGLFRVGNDNLIEHLAGTGTAGVSGDGGPAVAAEIAPEMLQVDAAGNTWFLTQSGSRLRRVSAGGTISTVAGIGESGSDGDGSAATSARIQAVDFAVAPNGDVIVLESDWDQTAQLRLRRIDAATGTIGPVALDDPTFCLPEGGEGGSASQFSPRSDGTTLEFVGMADEVQEGGDWSRCMVDLTTGTTQRASLGIAPTDDKRSNIELSGNTVWFLRGENSGLETSGLIRLGDGGAAPPVVSLGDASGLERDLVTGSVFVPVFLSRAVDEPVTVSFFTTDGSAEAGADYLRWGTTTRPRTITIPAGALQTTINVRVLTDSAAEGNESFSVVASSVSGAGAVLGVDTGVATIVDADSVSATAPAITVSDGTVIEGDEGQRLAQFLIHLSRPSASGLTVSYTTVDGSASAPGDYKSKLPGTVVFAPGQISKTIDVLVGSNTSAGDDRGFGLAVTVSGGSPVEELSMTGTATVVDDD